MKSAVIASVTLLAATTGAFAQFTIGSDSFEIADHPTGDRLTIGTSGIPFYSRNATGANLSISIANDSTFGSNVIRQMSTLSGNASNQLIGVLPLPIVLANVNDFITLSFKFRFLNLATATPNSAGFRFGIWGDNGTAVTADGQGGASDDDQGYYVQTAVITTTPPGTSNLFYNEGKTPTVAPIGGGVDRDFVTASGAGFSVTDENVHTGLFTIRRASATTMSLTVTYDGTTTFTGTSSGAIRTSFNEIGFNDGFVANPVHFAIDDVVVTSNVPEPASGLICAVGLTALAASRRRVRK